MDPMRVLIADDHEVFRRSLRSLIESRSEWKVCGEAGDGREAIEKALSLHPDVILMDVSMPEVNGLDATRAIRRQMPDSKVLIVSQNDPTLMARQADEVGACNFISKARVASDLMPVMEAVLAVPKSGQNGANAAELVTQSVAEGAPASEMATLIKNKDWSKTPLGPPETWSPTLRMMIDFILANRFPILLWWGPEYVQFYNDAYKPIPGVKHPKSLGQRASECWSEIWHILKPLVDTPFNGGPSTWSEDLELELLRSNFLEETHFTIAYSPVPDSTAPRGIGGVSATVHEITDKVIGERRLALLRELASRGAEGKTAQEACLIAAETLAKYPKDVPFALFYLLDSQKKHAYLAATAGVKETGAGIPTDVEIDTATGISSGWPLSSVLQENRMAVVEGIASRFKDVPLGPWSDPPNQAVIVPIPSNKPHELRGMLIVGVSVRLPLNNDYRTFFDLIASQLATAISNAEAYEEERRRAEALAEIDRAKTLFFNNVSHEFRTPLTLMLGPLEDALAQPEGLGIQQRESLEVAHRNSLRLLKLVNALLDFSRLEAGRMQASYQPTDLASFTAELASVFRSAMERAGLKFTVDCENIGEEVYVDREMWEKIVFNLLSNAFKFTFKGGVEVRLQKAGSEVQLLVKDTGTGIATADLPHLFERFYRVKDAGGRSFEGSGIGLALVQELAKLHGGSVKVKSEPGRGSTFVVSIPLGKEHLPADRICAPRPKTSSAPRGDVYVDEALRWLPQPSEVAVEASSFGSTQPKGASKPRIILADDNADMREYVQRLLGPDFDVIAVNDGQAALQAARELEPDLILSDVMMPKLDGLGLLRAIRSEESLKRSPVILLSARAGEESRVEGIDSGADDYLVKPFSARELLTRVRSQLTLARMRSEASDRERKLHAQSELERQRLYELFLSVPAAVCLLSGPEHRYTFVNDEYLRVTGRRDASEFLGKTVREALPEFAGQPFFELLDNVYSTGVPHVGRESKVVLNNAAGVPQEVYHNFIYQPQRAATGVIEGILVHVTDVTGEVLARKELEKRERAASLLAAIVASSDDAIVSKTLDGVITSWNKSAERIFGHTAEEAIGHHITLIIPPDRYKEEDEIIARLRRGERIDHFQTVRMRKDGTLVDVSLTISPVRNAAGQVIGASKVARDITDEKRTELSLRQSEARLRALVTASANALYRTNPDWSEMWELDGDGFISKSSRPVKNWLREYVHPEDRQIVEESIRQAIRTKSVFELEHRVQRLGGTVGWTHSRAVPLFDANGEIIEWFGSAIDVTHRKKAEELLRVTNQRFDFVAEAAEVGFWFCDLPLDKLKWDARVKEHFFLPPEAEVTIDCFYERIHPDDRAHTREAIERCIAEDSPYDVEYRTVSPNGEEKWIHAIGRCYYDEQGRPTRFDGLTIDVTALKNAQKREREIAAESLAAQEKYRELAERLELEVLARTKELEERNADIFRQSELLRDLSRRLLQAQDEERRRIARELHDSAGQTLTVLGMNLAVIARKVPNNPEMNEQIREADSLVQQLHQEIRTMSYLLHPPLLDEAGLRAALTWYVEGLRSRSGLQMTLEIADNFERLSRDIELVVFRLVQESLTNIHRHSGSKTAAIRITRTASSVTLEVKDEGKGMSAKKLAEIQARGSGVGIRGMRERVRHLQGDLKVESDESGTRVIVTIPIPKQISQEEALPLQAAV